MTAFGWPYVGVGVLFGATVAHGQVLRFRGTHEPLSPYGAGAIAVGAGVFWPPILAGCLLAGILWIIGKAVSA